MRFVLLATLGALALTACDGGKDKATDTEPVGDDAQPTETDTDEPTDTEDDYVEYNVAGTLSINYDVWSDYESSTQYDCVAVYLIADRDGEAPEGCTSCDLAFAVEFTASTTSCDSSWFSYDLDGDAAYIGIDTTIEEAYLYTQGDWYFLMDGEASSGRFQGTGEWYSATGLDIQELLDVTWE